MKYTWSIHGPLCVKQKGGDGAMEEERAAGLGNRDGREGVGWGVEGREGGRDHFALPFRMAFMV